MPINEPIKNRKVAPASLAFEGESKSRGAIFQVGTTPTTTTYQEIINIYEGDINILNINTQIFDANNDKLMTALGQSEHRSKHWTGDYKRTFEWDLTQNQVYTFNQYSNIAYNNEVMRGVGCYSIGTPANGSARWFYTVPDDAAGSWWIYAHVNLKFSSASNVYEARLAFFIDGAMWRIVDMADNNMMGENQIRDLRLGGGCHVPLRPGATFEVRIIVMQNQQGTDTSLYPDSVYSYVSGHRENCDGYAPLNPQSTGLSYTFDHNL